MNNFSPLTESNYKKVYEIEKQCFTSEAWSETLFFDEIGDENKYYAVYSNDEGEVGFGSYVQIFDEGHILNIAVLPSHRQKGIGTKILENLIETGIKNGISAFTLEVRVSNVAAQKLYERMGFVNVGARKKYYPDKEDAYIYWLYL